MNLLVIEDDRKLNRMLCEILEKEGYTVKACTDGEEGAYYLQQNAYDLALVDWMLPGESGPDILRESRRKGIMTPVVMLTALTAVENKVTCLDAGADDYLGKPFDSRELLARVRANLRRQAPIEELVVLRYGDLVYDTKALLLACGREEIAVSKKLGDFSFLLRFGFSAVYYVICLIECFPVDDLQFWNILRTSIFCNYVACIPLVADNSDYVARLELCSGTGTQSSII